jgi:hypothetical protein
MGKMEQYLNFVRATGWTLFIVFLLIGAVLAAMATYQSMRRRSYYSSQIAESRVVSKEGLATEKRVPMIEFYSPVILSSSEYVMIPVGQSLVSNKLIDNYRSDYTNQYATNHYSGADYNNILFIKKGGGETHFLFDKKVAITTFKYPSEQKTGTNDGPFLLFGVVEKDNNHDGKLTDEDAVRAYISDFSGKNLLPLNPEGTKFEKYDFDKEKNVAYVSYKTDGNNDLRFNAIDQSYLSEVDVSTGKVTRMIIDDEVIKNVKTLVF